MCTPDLSAGRGVYRYLMCRGLRCALYSEVKKIEGILQRALGCLEMHLNPGRSHWGLKMVMFLSVLLHDAPVSAA